MSFKVQRSLLPESCLNGKYDRMHRWIFIIFQQILDFQNYLKKNPWKRVPLKTLFAQRIKTILLFSKAIENWNVSSNSGFLKKDSCNANVCMLVIKKCVLNLNALLWVNRSCVCMTATAYLTLSRSFSFMNLVKMMQRMRINKS